MSWATSSGMNSPTPDGTAAAISRADGGCCSASLKIILQTHSSRGNRTPLAVVELCHLLDCRKSATYTNTQGMLRNRDSQTTRPLFGQGEVMAAKYDRVIISGEVQANIDAVAMARVVIMLARQWQERQEIAESTEVAESEATS